LIVSSSQLVHLKGAKTTNYEGKFRNKILKKRKCETEIGQKSESGTT